MGTRAIGHLAAAWMVVTTGAAWSAPQATEPPKDVLKGPSADPSAPPTSPGVFGDPAEARPGRPASGGRAKYELFQRALSTLMKDDAPAGARLDEQQMERVRTIQHEFRQANEAFFREHQEEIRRIREQTGNEGPARPAPRGRDGAAPEGKPGEAPKKESERPARRRPTEEMSPASREDLMRRLRELEEQRPDPGPYQARVWEVLREEQRAHVTTEMERAAEEIAKRRGEERLQKEREERAKNPGAGGREREAKPERDGPGSPKPGGDRARDGAAGDLPNAARLAQRLQISEAQAEKVIAALRAPEIAADRGLTPAQRIERRVNSIPESVLPASKRETLAQMLASRAQQRGAAGGDRPAERGKDRKGSDVPPPSVDDVNVPRP